jgi:hypothetical protein
VEPTQGHRPSAINVMEVTTMADTAESSELGLHRKKCEVEIVPPPGLRATLEASVHEGDPALPPTNIISVNQEILVKVKWCVLGDLRRHLCGTWCVKVAWESCGPGPEEQSPPRHVDFDPCLPDNKCYETEFRFPPGTLPAGDCGTVYTLCVTLSSERVCNGTKYAGLIFGFCDDVARIMVRPG